jgi:AraC-like DNA-binding protein
MTLNDERGTSTIRVENLPPESGIRLLDGENITHQFPAHVHESYTLGMVTRGQRYIHVAGQDYLIHEKEGFIISPLIPHSCGPAAEEGHDYRIISVDTGRMKDAAADVIGRECLPVFSCVRLYNESLISRLINLLNTVSQIGTAWEKELHSLLVDLVTWHADGVDEASITRARTDLARQARAFLDANLRRTVTLEELAEEMHVSPFYVDRVFREVIGVPPHVYQLQTRVKRAAETLVKTGSILEASYYFGFADQSHFSRIFKKNVGVSPGRFLKTNKKRMP